MIEIIIAVAALAAGLAVGLLLGRRKAETVRNEAERRVQERLDEAAARHSREIADTRRQALEEAEAINARVSEQMQRRFDETVALMQEQLRGVTDDMLRRRQKEFSAQSSEDLNRILEPLRHNLDEMRREVNKNTERHTELGGRMEAGIRNLLEHSDSARQSADRLANALRAGGRIQGDWGETILTELLESQGLKEGVHFDTQSVIRDEKGNLVHNETGNSLRPDVILHLDRNRDVVIDSKVSLTAFLDYADADAEDTRQEALKAHIRSLRKHVDELSRKDYSAHLSTGRQRMDYVIMFVPCTAAVHAALAKEPRLWREAMDRNVYIADEQTLYAALKIISMTWVQIAQEDNHRKVFDLADEMLRRVGQFMERYTQIGKSLDAARKAYDEGLKKLDDRGQSIPQTCSKLISLGAKSNPKLGKLPEN